MSLEVKLYKLMRDVIPQSSSGSRSKGNVDVRQVGVGILTNDLNPEFDFRGVDVELTRSELECITKASIAMVDDFNRLKRKYESDEYKFCLPHEEEPTFETVAKSHPIKLKTFRRTTDHIADHLNISDYYYSYDSETGMHSYFDEKKKQLLVFNNPVSFMAKIEVVKQL